MPTIMIADDSSFMRHRLVNLLTEHNYEVVEAKDGEEAIELYRQAQPDAVLLDFAMPGKNGLVTLRAIRQLNSEAKVIMLTALSQEAIAIQSMQAGAKDFVVKPFESEQLLKAVRRVLR
jgi:two-component system chemotaxis response regulator CheY